MSWKETLAAVAPTVATALGGPFAGVAVKMATKALGVEPSQEALEQVVTSGDPNALARLREIDSDFKVKMKELHVDLEKIHAQDRSSAREMAKSKGLSVQATLSAVFIIGYFAIFYMLLQQFFAPNPIKLSSEALSIMSLMLGVMTGAVKDILQFWFGSSVGSKEKTDKMALGSR